MNKREFVLIVRALVSPEDFEKYNHLLEGISQPNYDDYLYCLKYGGTMFTGAKALEKIIELSRETTLGTDDILTLVPNFRLIISILSNGKSN